MSGIYVPVTDWDAALDAQYEPEPPRHTRHGHLPIDEELARLIYEEERTWRESGADRD